MNDDQLTEKIKAIHKSCPNAGSGDVHARLRAQGFQIQQKRVRQTIGIHYIRPYYDRMKCFK